MMSAGPLVPADAWPRLTDRYGLLPSHVHLTPEEGGLTYEQLQAYVDHLDDPLPPRPVWMCEPPR